MVAVGKGQMNPSTAATLLNVLTNLICDEAPWVATAREDIAGKVAPLIRIFAEAKTLHGSSEVHARAVPVFILLLSNLVLSPEVSMPALRRATKDDNGLQLKTYLASKMITAGGSQQPPRFPGEEDIRKGCIQVFTEFFDIDGGDPTKYSEESRGEVGALLKLEVPKMVSGGGYQQSSAKEMSTLGQEFLPMLADPKTKLECAEGALYIYSTAMQGCPEVADGDGPGGFGLHCGMESIALFFHAKVFDSLPSSSSGGGGGGGVRSSSSERAEWARWGSHFLGMCLSGPTSLASDKRTAAFISSGALCHMLRATALFGDVGKFGLKGQEEEPITEYLNRMIGMIESVAGLKHTRVAVAALKLGTGVSDVDQAIDALVTAAKKATTTSSSNKKTNKSSSQGGGGGRGAKLLTATAERMLELRQRFVNVVAGSKVAESKKATVVTTKHGEAGSAGVACARCLQPAASGEGLKKCSKCPTKYCSRECQVDDWKNGGHKAICKMKQSVPTAKDFGRQEKDLSAQGNQVINDRTDAMAVIACLRGWNVVLDCVLVVEFGAGSPRAQPIPRAEFITHYLNAERIGAGEVEAQRAHTIAIMDRNRQNGAVTAWCHSSNTCVLKTLSGDNISNCQRFQGKKLAENVLGICGGDGKKARGVVAEALMERGMMSGEEIATLVWGEKP
jgi:hypothetical protein